MDEKTKQENEILKTHFKDNEALLKDIRGLLFGFKINRERKDTIKDIFKDEELKEAFRKRLYPILNSEVPIGQVQDYWSGTETNIIGQNTDTIYQVVMSKQRTLEMLETAMSLLENPDGTPIDLSYNPRQVTVDEFQTGLLARNLYIKTVETALHFVNLVANQKEETEKEKKERLTKDSTK